MAPRHDEIVKQLDDGFAVAWDTTERDETRVADVRKVAAERSYKLGRIIGTARLTADGAVAISGSARRRRSGQP